MRDGYGYEEEVRLVYVDFERDDGLKSGIYCGILMLGKQYRGERVLYVNRTLFDNSYHSIFKHETLRGEPEVPGPR